MVCVVEKDILERTFELVHPPDTMTCCKQDVPSSTSQVGRAGPIGLVKFQSSACRADSKIPCFPVWGLTTPLSKNPYSFLGFHLEVAQSS